MSRVRCGLETSISSSKILSWPINNHSGVPFEALPEDWRCPRCRQPKTKFSKA
ncbi:MAG: rubredoxin [Proteobacteria bacterium]|nr:rubredoxin [Pseudomonadota bacterium]